MTFEEFADPQQRKTLTGALEDYCLKNEIPRSDRRREVASRRIVDLHRSGMRRAAELELILRDLRF